MGMPLDGVASHMANYHDEVNFLVADEPHVDVTRVLQERNVDLVIKNSKHMKILLRFLVYSIKTIDGRKNSAIPLLNQLNKENPKSSITKNEKLVFEKMCKKY